MVYTVWSKGELVGETELGFRGLGFEQCRSGHFLPTARGLELIDALASESHCMRAYMHRDFRDANGMGLLDEEYEESDEFADVAEYLHHLTPFALELRDEHNTVIAVSEIGIQDKHPWCSTKREGDTSFATDQEFEREMERAVEVNRQQDTNFQLPETFPKQATVFDQRTIDALIAHDAEQMDGMDYDSTSCDVTTPVGWGYEEAQGDNELGSGWNTTLRDVPIFPRYQVHVILAGS
ncbi:MAG: hypothetical protein ABI120_07355 [Gemmatimonadaceae bacterium]